MSLKCVAKMVFYKIYYMQKKSPYLLSTFLNNTLWAFDVN